MISMATDSAIHLSMRARLARSEQVHYAARAQLRMPGVGADIRPVVPAALALGMRARMNLERYAAQACRRRVARLMLHQARLRGDEDKAQVIGKRLQQFKIGALRVQLDFTGKG